MKTNAAAWNEIIQKRGRPFFSGVLFFVIFLFCSYLSARRFLTISAILAQAAR